MPVEQVNPVTPGASTFQGQLQDIFPTSADIALNVKNADTFFLILEERLSFSDPELRLAGLMHAG